MFMVVTLKYIAQLLPCSTDELTYASSVKVQRLGTLSSAFPEVQLREHIALHLILEAIDADHAL